MRQLTTITTDTATATPISVLCAECDRLKAERERRTQALAAATAQRKAAEVLSESIDYINSSAAAYEANLNLEIAEIEMRFHLRWHKP